MKNFAKGTAFLVFGVLLSPMMLGMMVPVVAWETTENQIIVALATIVSFSAWVVAYDAMIARKWHYHV